MKRCYLYLSAVVLSLFSQLSAAATNIGSTGNTGFALMEQWLQNFVDFMDGPFGVAVVSVSVILAACVWMFMPREGWVGVTARVVTAGLVIINVPTWVSTF